MVRYVFYVILIITLLYSNNIYSDYANPHYERMDKLRDARKFYRDITKKEPTLQNLIKSIEIKNPVGFESAEIRYALDIFTLKGMKTKEIIDKVIQCYENNLEDETIRLICAEYLVKLNVQKSRGIEFLKLMLIDDKVSLSMKILVAGTLVRNGNLEGYSVIKNGLLELYPGGRQNAMWLLKRFVPYDGKVYNEKGDKVDIKGLIESVKDKMDPEDYEKMMKIVFPK